MRHKDVFPVILQGARPRTPKKRSRSRERSKGRSKLARRAWGQLKAVTETIDLD